MVGRAQWLTISSITALDSLGTLAIKRRLSFDRLQALLTGTRSSLLSKFTLACANLLAELTWHLFGLLFSSALEQTYCHLLMSLIHPKPVLALLHLRSGMFLTL